ncbi:hypothetical protein ABAC460_11330 [Asticcacaulis sp. AC460]|uniref:DUF1523 family protein n=1 Tax=Asticcacaulis sp. AC460 TaxID=1282360 RepID=UPI0003C3ACC7|nr:DUF1523 family protein [Asticcacaulis sp. AC460]ESQ89886.1 hypothetical protein ABAC460_11330 [Asticcacaulis sp. AC460]
MKRLIVTILVVVVAVFVGWATCPYWTAGSTEVTVTHVENKLMDRHGKRQDVYLVFTSDGTYRNTDSLHYFKFNSSDIQGKLAQQGRFKISYYGFRVPVLSMYKNITKAEKIE